MDHMRISGIEPSSVILSQTNCLKGEKFMLKSAKKGKVKDGVINP